MEGKAAGTADLPVPTPAHLAERMIRQRPSEGERRTVTALFADAVGSTALAERVGEEEMYGLMRECLGRMGEAVHLYEGHLAAFTGDGMMALFGAPIAHEDSARRAVAAALTIQRSLGDYADRCRFRVGLNTGPVVVGTVTDDLRMDFTAVGDTVNLAARMEQLAEPGGVCISEFTHRAVADFFDCQPLGPVAVKGKAHPVPAWRVLLEKPLRTRFEVAAERGLSPLVGRDRELGVLEGYLDLARQGTGQVVLVSGEAGIGKSRLLLELRRRAGEAVPWLEGHCVSFGQNIAYLPIVDALKHAFGIGEGDDETRIIAQVDATISAWKEPARRAGPYLKYLLSVDPGDAAVAGMDPLERRIGVFDAVRTVLLEEAARQPLVVVVEDLHWADQMSQDALTSLVDVVPSAPVLLILTHRPGFSHSLGERAGVTRLALGQLAEAESTALCRGVLQVASLPAELEGLIASKAEGNPFYVEEVSKALVETGAVSRANGSFRLERRVEDIHIPETIQEVILSRIDRLEQEARVAMQLAAVIGREFTARILERISEQEAKLSEVLSELKAFEFIYEKAYFPELAYMFKHALTHDVAYATLLADRRRALHRAVGSAIEELYGDRLAEHYEELAHHYSEAHDWAKALDYLEKAGDKAVAAFANQDALAFYRRALEVRDGLKGEALTIAASLAAKRGFVNFRIGQPQAAAADFDQMLGVARQLDDRSLEGMALAYRGNAEFWAHDFATAETTLRSALTLADEGFDDVRALASLFFGLLLVVTNRLPEAARLWPVVREHETRLNPFGQAVWGYLGGRTATWSGRFDEALEMLERGRPASSRVISQLLMHRWCEAQARVGSGQYEAALELLHETKAICERVGDGLVRSRLFNVVGWIYGDLQDHERALRWNLEGVEVSRAAAQPIPEVEMQSLLNVGENLLALGRVGEAEECFAEVERVVRQPTPKERWMHWRLSQRFFYDTGLFALVQGDSAEALTLAAECLRLAERSDSRKHVAMARRLMGQAFVAEGRFDDAERELSTALQLAVAVGNPPQLWKTQVAIGDLRTAEARPDDARRAYRQALDVIEVVAAGLNDVTLRATFLDSQHIQSIQLAAEHAAGSSAHM